MEYSIVFSSNTGNTAQLAKIIKESLPKDEIVYYGTPSENAILAPTLFVGFWTNRGTCDELTKAFLKSLHNKKVFLFGTAGFGGDEDYFKKIGNTIKENIDSSVQIEGFFMCQGKMPLSVLERYKKMLVNSLNPESVISNIDNFNRALVHPNQDDLETLRLNIKTYTTKKQGNI